ncbi:hypothetical protein HRG_003557 [Hirsutella rhossiliensis]|uniref:Uncharacterized protein n=1 Tax=Hirsutella rhossiliensis TaxID=111463 RepID=A0A9P8SLV6_9HYPO|nr:uncharacterized protein HRG_03557 [Hirsutella rhossiliensis]KAH0965541.1 hypothetical protein HRG_03557 [Hirsutella rhossiliensis]
MAQLLYLVFSLCSLAAVGLVWSVFIQNNGLDTINQAISHGRYPDNEVGVTSFTGLRAIDDALMSLVAFNLPILNVEFEVGRLFMAQFVANVSIMIFILSVEGQRGRKRSPLIPMAWGLFSQLATSAVALPLYLLVQTGSNRKASRKPIFQSLVSPHAALCALPSHLLGFGVPAVMMFDPFRQGDHIKSLWVLMFALCPLNIAICTKTVGVTKRAFLPSSPKAATTTNAGYNALQLGYTTVGVVAAAFHAMTILQAIKHPGRFNGLFSLELYPEMLRDKIMTFLKLDYLITFAALLTWAYSEVLAIRRGGSLMLLGMFVFGTLVFGPGATTAIAWSARETGLHRGSGKSG